MRNADPQVLTVSPAPRLALDLDVYQCKLSWVDVDWTHGAEHMWVNHGVTVDEASEAVADVDALLYDPDPKSRSGRSARLLGYSRSRGRVLVVILVHREDRAGGWWGANGWDAHTADTATYRKENEQ